VYTILFAKSWTKQTNQQRNVNTICQKSLKCFNLKSMSFNPLPSKNNFDSPIKIIG